MGPGGQPEVEPEPEVEPAVVRGHGIWMNYHGGTRSGQWREVRTSLCGALLLPPLFPSSTPRS
eukprot:COSAG01_NODE_9474_length_2436_cov_20.451006_2_plen_63_part_00